MSSITVKEREIVIPGDVLAEGMDYLPGNNTYREQEKVFSKVLGLVSVSGRVLKVTALAGPYIPKAGDKIIGRVKDILISGWRMYTATAYSAVMNVRDATDRFIKKEEDLSQVLGIGEYVVMQITNVTSQNLIDVTMKGPGLRKITQGRVIQINSHKVPRVIGKKGSMITLLKNYTGCNITVGQNGLVWISGESAEKEYLAEQAIKRIEAKSHEEGLTEKMETFLKEHKK